MPNPFAGGNPFGTNPMMNPFAMGFPGGYDGMPMPVPSDYGEEVEEQLQEEKVVHHKIEEEQHNLVEQILDEAQIMVLKEIYGVQLKAIEEMGYLELMDESKILQILRHTNGNVENAVEYILDPFGSN